MECVALHGSGSSSLLVREVRWVSVHLVKKPQTRWACPPRCVLDRSVYQPTQWTEANVAHLSVTLLGGHAHL
ncbi:unnamed protein product [Boreogadus saida]